MLVALFFALLANVAAVQGEAFLTYLWIFYALLSVWLVWPAYNESPSNTEK
jgi:hypothetical protein